MKQLTFIEWVILAVCLFAVILTWDIGDQHHEITFERFTDR